MIVDKSEPLIKFTQITTIDNYYLSPVQQVIFICYVVHAPAHILPLQSSDEDTPTEEEEVIKLQKERAEFLRDEDFGLQTNEQDDSDEEPTVGVKKDLNALSRDEQMDFTYYGSKKEDFRAPWYSLLWCHTIGNKLVRRYAKAECQRSMRPEIEGDSSVDL
ncbi:hypothetical protein Cgig2_006309 [Carnegiea gigantea]|uniref:Uncharacterized protein n=1 Tax=Carnegiea gigantea TaxID=171969 RepID=A0A9Q1QEA7_9CARY|nr:hypothetical protein Cgig2_006309 [Carnegiea gigantea]